ncbi:MAG: right-handed parallel beta-helix repeat-containing protein [Chitinophagaceae bacterium]|nr:right-handed parallel beta-helix repeat-containing protein [Chitinophagaceae bacterium]
MKNFLFTPLIFLVFSAVSFAGKKYVAVGGSNAANGNSPATAYATLVYAVTHVPVNDTLMVIAGATPFKEIGITITSPMTIMASGAAVIDATGLTFSPAVPYILAVVNTSNVEIIGLTIQNGIYTGTKGIWILRDNTGSARMRNITVRNCTIRNIGWISNNLQAPQYNSSVGCNAIRIEGVHATQSLSSVSIRDNVVKNCATGWGEAITVTHHTDTFRILNNIVDSIANIGIGASGNYNYAGAPPAAVNFTRNGIISGNTVSNCMSGNAISAGIYVDGGRQHIVENNRCFRNAVGLSLGAEQPAGSNLITGNIYRNNLIYDNVTAGLVLGSFTANNGVRGNYIVNNTFFKNCTAVHINGIDSIGVPPFRYSVETIVNGAPGEALLLHDDKDTLFNNILYPAPARIALVGMDNTVSTNFGANYNLYFHEDGSPLFFFTPGKNLNGVTGGFTLYTVPAFTTLTGQEGSGNFGNPAFTNAAAFNLQLTACSFAINKGNPVSNAAITGVYDFTASTNRVVDGRADAGAYEYPVPAMPCNFTLRLPEASCSGTVNQIKLSWTPSVNATSYEIYRGAALINTVTDTLYTDVLPAAGTYSYVIKARKATAVLDNANGPQSGMVNCTVTGVTNPSVNIRTLRVWPNPSRGIVTLWYVSARPGNALVRVFSANGSLVYHKTVLLKPGVNTFELDIRHLPAAALYHINLGGQQLKLVIQ